MIKLNHTGDPDDGFRQVACFSHVLAGLRLAFLEELTDDDEDEADTEFVYDWANKDAYPYNGGYWEGFSRERTRFPASRWLPIVEYYCQLLPHCFTITDEGYLYITAQTIRDIPRVMWALHDIRKYTEWPGIARLIVQLMDKGLSPQAALAATYGVVTEHEYGEERGDTLPVINTTRELCHLLPYGWNPPAYYEVLSAIGGTFPGRIRGYPSDVISNFKVKPDQELLCKVFPKAVKLDRSNCHVAGQVSGTVSPASYYLGTGAEFINATVKLHGSNKQ